ncbi:Uncharacterised protein [Serratia plymuthica]|uniref:hypothetical protein n=1 Tax=Serratia plymuthica TaxID=82996 RepID=UPI00217B24C4|nr:hypothetical protein [Serratia plymuthica]CAI0730660.1 Uncharacterised protein [Serratia plymuthica]
MTLTTERLKWLLVCPGMPGQAEMREIVRELLANREAQPVGFYTTVSGRKGVVWHNGAPEDDTAIFTAPPAPAVTGELLEAMDEVISISDRDHEAWDRAKAAIAACRAALPESNAELLDVATALREWIDAVPSELAASLPMMPGVDRDWVDEVISNCRAAMLAQPQIEQQNIQNNIPDGLAAAVNRLLDSDGSRGCFSAVRSYDAREEIERLLAQPVSQGYALNSPETPDGCQWTFDEHDSKWDSGCGEAWMFCDGGPTENGVKFCQNCGKPVLLAAAPEGGNG